MDAEPRTPAWAWLVVILQLAILGFLVTTRVLDRRLRREYEEQIARYNEYMEQYEQQTAQYEQQMRAYREHVKDYEERVKQYEQYANQHERARQLQPTTKPPAAPDAF